LAEAKPSSTRNRIFGAIGVLWGGGVLAHHFLSSAPPAASDSAYGAGVSMGLVFGAAMLAAGVYYLVRG
jgi:hypothetical protein